ncbi:MAG: DUF3293 domain-containing protein [Gemmatimonadales bacterium]|nr:DUF3293 domain-containing protein [Gemmatimonadales bacterium]
MAPRYIEELAERYPELRVDHLCEAAGIRGTPNKEGRRFLEKLRNKQVAKVFDPKIPARKAEELRFLEEWIKKERAAGDPHEGLASLVSYREGELSKISGDELALSSIQIRQEAFDTYFDDEARIAKQAKLISDLDALHAHINPNELGANLIWPTLDQVIRDSLVQIVRNFVEATNTAILNVKRRQAHEESSRNPTTAPPARELTAAFASTIIEVEHPEGTITVPAGTTGRNNGWPWAQPVWVVTAHNPGGTVCSTNWNRGANTSLRNSLKKQGIEFVRATGRSPDRTWSESGYALVGISKSQALTIARQCGQLAIFRLHNWRRTVNKTGINKVDKPPKWKPGSTMGVGTYQWDSWSEWYCVCGHEPDDHKGPEEDVDVDSVEWEYVPCTLCDCGNYAAEFGPWLSECLVCGVGEFFHETLDLECPGFYDGPTCEICDVSHLNHLEDRKDWDEARDACDEYIPRSDIVYLDTASGQELMSLGLDRATAMAIIRTRPHGTISLSLLDVDGIETKTICKLVDSDRVV